jgi:hypothetical protein
MQGSQVTKVQHESNRVNKLTNKQISKRQPRDEFSLAQELQLSVQMLPLRGGV